MWFTLMILADIFLFFVLPWVFLGMPWYCVVAWIVFYYTALQPTEWPAFRSWCLWDSLRRHYFKLEVKGPGRRLFLQPTAQEQEGTQQFIFAVHPHTIFAISATFFFATNTRFARYKSSATSLLFAIPLVREFSAWAGAVKANRPVLEDVLRANMGLILCPGGMREVGQPNETDIVKRKGFLRLAGESGATVVPVWSAQERRFYSIKLLLGTFFLDHGLYYQWPIFVWGQPWFRFWPRMPPEGQTSRLYIGEPLKVNGTDEESIDAAHTVFYERIESLQALAADDESPG